MSRVVERLEPLLTEARVRRMRNVLAGRTDHVAFVFERMIDPHNLSAALRSLDAFSFQDVHLVQPGERLAEPLGRPPPEEPSPAARRDVARGITIGSDRWLTLRQWPDTPACIAGLHDAGYTVYASHLGAEDSTPLTELELGRRTALVFGNERLGVSEEVRAHADGNFHIPMHGFAQSLNLSVAVAVSAFHARQALARLAAEAGDPDRFALGAERRQALYEQWLRQSVKRAEEILAGDEAGDGP